MEKEVIKRGKYTLPIPSELKNNLNEYLKVRQYLLSKLEKTQEMLFIECNGEPIDNLGASDKLFNKVMGEDSPKKSTPFAKRCIERMVKEGFNAETIKEITGYSATIYKSACDFVNKNNSIQNKLTEFIMPPNNSKVRKIGYIDCPMCGKKTIKATSDELVLIKRPGDSTLYLACKECGERERKKGEMVNG